MPVPPPEHRRWWPGWESNPQNPRSERGTYARFRHRAMKLVRAEGLEPPWATDGPTGSQPVPCCQFGYARICLCQRTRTGGAGGTRTLRWACGPPSDLQSDAFSSSATAPFFRHSWRRVRGSNSRTLSRGLGVAGQPLTTRATLRYWRSRRDSNPQATSLPPTGFQDQLLIQPDLLRETLVGGVGIEPTYWTL